MTSETLLNRLHDAATTTSSSQFLQAFSELPNTIEADVSPSQELYGRVADREKSMRFLWISTPGTWCILNDTHIFIFSHKNCQWYHSLIRISLEQQRSHFHKSSLVLDSQVLPHIIISIKITTFLLRLWVESVLH